GRPAGPARPLRSCTDALPAIVGRAAAAAVAGRGGDRPAGAGVPRRAHGGARPAGPARLLGAGGRAARGRGVGGADHPPHGRGGAAGRPRGDHRPGAGGGRGQPGLADRGRAAAPLPRPPGAGAGGAAQRAAAGQRGQGVAVGPLHRRGPGRPRAAGHGDRVVRGGGRDGRRPAHRAAHAGGRVPGADGQGAAVTSTAKTLDLTPAPGAAPFPRMVLAQTGAEVRAMLRNGEQLLLTMIIPVLLLVGFSPAPLIDVGGGRRVDFLAPGVLAPAVMSTAFTGQAIATGFERRYGVLKRLGATPLSRGGLMLAKTAAVLVVEAVQVAVLVAVAVALGWSPQGSPVAAVLAGGVLVLLGTAAFSGLGL